jgi:hypothetical protein
MYKIIVSVCFQLDPLRPPVPASTSDLVGKTRLQSWLFLETRILTIIVGMHILLCFLIYVYACFHECLEM